MLNRLTNQIKYSRLLYSLYYHVMNFVMNFLKLFVRTDRKLILFNSYGGRKYDDSPRAIYEKMAADARFCDWHFVWAFHEPDKLEERPEGCKIIRTNSFKYFITAMKAQVWITNSSVERGLSFKKKKTLYFNTWHGTPLKKMGDDIAEDAGSFAPKKSSVIDIMMAQSDLEVDVFSRMFKIPETHFLKAGLPRNDVLVGVSGEQRRAIREKLGLPEDKKVILYCPTFREYEKDEHGCVLVPPMDLAKWERELGDAYVLLFRAHYEVARVMDFKETEFVRNMTAYPVLNELYIASDILISDYSSAYFDYSITGKPMLHFTYDYDQYARKRGMYFDIREYISGAADEDGLIELLEALEAEKEARKTAQFREKYVSYYGHAAEAAVEELARKLGTEGTER